MELLWNITIECPCGNGETHRYGQWAYTGNLAAYLAVAPEGARIVAMRLESIHWGRL